MQLTVWFPVRLASVIRGAVPRVDRYTELGKRRSRVELDHEYERQLDRDKNPFSFLYKGLSQSSAQLARALTDITLLQTSVGDGEYTNLFTSLSSSVRCSSSLFYTPTTACSGTPTATPCQSFDNPSWSSPCVVSFWCKVSCPHSWILSTTPASGSQE